MLYVTDFWVALLLANTSNKNDTRMVFEKIGDSHKGLVPENCQYDHALVAGDKIWVFGRRYEDQKSFNWGHRVAYVGTYAIAFNIAENKWEDAKPFPAVSTEQNLDENFFVHNGTPYMLLYAAFGSISLKSLYKWNGTSFEPVNLQGFDPISGSEKSVNVNLEIADSQDDNIKYIITTMEHRMRVARLTFSGNGAKAEHLFDIALDDGELALAMATSAVVTGSRLLVSYGVTGCGFRWTAEGIVACDLNSKNCEKLDINSDPKPHWGFSGAHSHALLPSGSWIHAAGDIPQGMTGHVYDGSVWELNNLSSSPTWKKLEVEIPNKEDGEEIVVDPAHGTIYLIGKTQIGKVKFA
ncbi:unnamed protein product [Cylicocyclus nassatus]|uniref:Uncharacterized protein n=1 Tax=Cylicocyclus nassatus TaxID=53992 RepID=A0AA36GS97_CYLNA|nr:unnamed protein product [Cylicocyclus nassatus]